jgi:uncharacterized LabA/DUF88 family protein
MTKYLFIDGGFLEAMISKSGKFFGIDLSSSLFHYADICKGFQRTFYYDALPSERDAGKEAFQAKLAAKLTLFERINRTPYMHTREGITRNRAARRMLEQKGVDILLAIDVFKHASLGNMSEAHIMATDLDFFPLFEALRDTPVSVHLHCYAPETSEELMSLADVVIPITPITILRWLRHPDSDKFVERNISTADFANARLTIKEGMCEGLPFYIFEVSSLPKNRFFGQSMAINSHSASRAERWEYIVAEFEATHGKRIFFDK